MPAYNRMAFILFSFPLELFVNRRAPLSVSPREHPVFGIINRELVLVLEWSAA